MRRADNNDVPMMPQMMSLLLICDRVPILYWSCYFAGLQWVVQNVIWTAGMFPPL
jgi:hypothetical protein